MRVVTVLAIIAIGAGMGTAAVLVPLTSRSPLKSTSWLVDWDVPAVRRMVAQLPNLTGPRPEARQAAAGPQSSPDVPPVVHLAAPAQEPHGGQDARTFDVLTQAPAPMRAADAREADRPWATTVVPAANLGQRARPSSKPANDDQRHDLVRAIQTELKRVGCFEGSADGQWNGSTKRAMGQFTDRVNATLPFDEPDLILLTLVKGHRGAACGDQCPAGQGRAENGHCEPASILARAERQRANGRVRVAQPTDGALARSANEAAPVAAAPPVSSTSVIARATQTGSIAVSPQAPLAALPQVRTQVAVQPEPEFPVRSALAPLPAPPLPGRMAMGAPLPAASADEAAPVTETAKPDPELDRPERADLPRHRQPSIQALPAPPAVTHRPLPPIVIRRPPPLPRPPQYTAVQPKKQKWHPANPFWQ